MDPCIEVCTGHARCVVSVHEIMSDHVQRHGHRYLNTQVRVGDTKRRTKVHKKGGVAPLFDETLEFDLTGEA